MAAKLVSTYRAFVDGKANVGRLFFRYDDDTTGLANDIRLDAFQAMLDILRNEEPVLADHTVPLVATMQPEDPGEGEV